MRRSTHNSTARTNAALSLLPPHLREPAVAADTELNRKDNAPAAKPRPKPKPVNRKSTSVAATPDVLLPEDAALTAVKKRARNTKKDAAAPQPKKMRINDSIDSTPGCGSPAHGAPASGTPALLMVVEDAIVDPTLSKKRKSAPEHPGAPDQPRVKRTSDQVAEDRRKLEALDAQQRALDDRRKKMLAEMELEQEEEDAREDDAIVRAFVPEPVSEEDGVDNGDEEFHPEANVTKPKAPYKKKPAKGETRKAVEAVKAAVVAEKKKVNGSTDNQINISVKKTPSSLHPDWQTRQSTRINTIPAKKEPGKAKTHYTPFDVGGLDENDVADDKPSGTPGSLRGRAKQIVSIASETPIQPASVKAAKRMGLNSTPTPLKNKVKVENTPDSRGLEDRNPFLKPCISGDGDTANLPAFIKNIYQTEYLPMVWSYMYSTLPFGPEFAKSDGLEKMVKARLNELIPNNTYMPGKDDRLCTLSYDRCKDKCGRFGSLALDFVKEQVAGMDKMQTATWCNYALRPNGLALYKIPTPYDCTLTPQDKGYIAPSGLGESEAFITVFKNVVKSSLRDSKFDYGHPVGAFGLTAAALIWAYGFYCTGVFLRDDKDTFSQPKVGASVLKIIDIGRKLSDNAWARIHAAAGTSPDPPVTDELDSPTAEQPGEFSFEYLIPASSPGPSVDNTGNDDENDDTAAAV